MMRNVALLAAVQACAMTGAGLVVLVTALAGAAIAPKLQWSTLALALQFAATMATTIPASFLMQKIGRKHGFIIGQLIGLVGGLISCQAIITSNFTLFLIGGMLLGSHNAFWGYLRFAAGELVPETQRPRAISWVLAGGVVAAISAAEIGKLTADMIPQALYAATYLAIASLSIIAIMILLQIPFPPLASQNKSNPGRPLSEIFCQPKAILATASAAIGYASMALLMTATPLAMAACGFAFDQSAFVIQWHAIAMFAPSFYTGRLIQRFGAETIIATGAAMIGACVMIALSGITLANFWLGLFLLGLGWNFTFIGGTSLLGECHEPNERAQVQAANDFCVFSLVAIASLSAGYTQTQLGWNWVNITAVIPVSTLLVLVCIRIAAGAKSAKA